MRDAPSAVSDYLAANATCWLCDLLTITCRQPATYPDPGARVIRLTSHEQSIYLYDDEAFTFVYDANDDMWAVSSFDGIVGHDEAYYAAGARTADGDYAPAFRRGTIRQSVGLAIDTLDITLEGAAQWYDPVRDLTQALAKHALEGLFDDADVRIDRFVGAYPGDLSLGLIDKYWTGVVGGVEPASLQVKLSCKSGLSRAQSLILPRIKLQAACNLALYSDACAVSRAAYAQDCEVASATASEIVVDTPSLTATADYYALGTILWQDGALAGTVSSVCNSDGQTLTLTRPLPAALVPTAGAAFTLLPGCDKTQATCAARFDNLHHYRGYPHVPQTGTGGLR